MRQFLLFYYPPSFINDARVKRIFCGRKKKKKEKCIGLLNVVVRSILVSYLSLIYFKKNTLFFLLNKTSDILKIFLSPRICNKLFLFEDTFFTDSRLIMREKVSWYRKKKKNVIKRSEFRSESDRLIFPSRLFLSFFFLDRSINTFVRFSS